MLDEFKKFALRGNVLDMAIGVIMGGAFGKIVTSIVNDMIMPLVGLLVGGIHFNSLKVVLSPAQLDAAGEVIVAESAILYGSFIQNIVDFLLISISIFIFIKLINKFHKKEEPAPQVPAGPTQEELLTEIRDLLKK